MDRGSWGTELLALLAAWKLALPASLLLLRGNHESSTCTKMYGFHSELRGKYGAKPSQVRASSLPTPSNMAYLRMIVSFTRAGAWCWLFLCERYVTPSLCLRKCPF